MAHTAWYDKRYQEIHGFFFSQSSDTEIISRLDKADQALVRDAIQAAIDPEDPRPYFARYRVYWDDGSFRWVECHGLAEFEGEGKERRVKCLVGTAEDITERRQAEEALRQSLMDLDRAQNVGKIGSWRLDVRQNILTWSDENHRIFGVPQGTPMTYEKFLEAMVKLLIIDDEKNICEEFREVLKQEGFDVDVATSGKDGLRKVRQNLYNLVFLDESMPGMEGDKVFESLREFSKVPVAFVSGFLTPSKERKVMSMGAVACLSKPLDLDQVKSLIHSVA